MASTCPECATEWPQEPAFCGRCGALLDTAALARPARPERSAGARAARWRRPVGAVAAGLLAVALAVESAQRGPTTEVTDPDVDISHDEARRAADLVGRTGEPICLGTTARVNCLSWEFSVAGLHDLHRLGDAVYGVAAGDLLSLSLDGNERFRVRLGPHAWILSADSSGLVTATDVGLMQVSRDGAIGWSAPGWQPVAGMGVHEGVLAARHLETGQLQGLDVVTGERRWRADAPHGVTTIAAEGAVVTGVTGDRHLEVSVLDHAAGDHRGKAVLEDTTSLRGVPAARGDIVVIVAVRNGAGHAIGVDVIERRVAWSTRLADLDVDTVSDGLVLSTADHGPVLVDPESGQVVSNPPGELTLDGPGTTRPWETVAVGEADASPVVLLRAPVTSPVGSMALWNPAADTLARFPVTRPTGARIEDDRILVWGVEELQVRDLDGRRRWSIPLPFAVPATGSPLVVAMPTGVARLDLPQD